MVPPLADTRAGRWPDPAVGPASRGNTAPQGTHTPGRVPVPGWSPIPRSALPNIEDDAGTAAQQGYNAATNAHFPARCGPPMTCGTTRPRHPADPEEDE